MGDQLIFHLGLANSSGPPLVLLVVLEAEEDLLVLEVEGQGLLARMPIGRKFASFLGRGATEGNSFTFIFTSMESNSLAAATCLTISLGFLATHLDRALRDIQRVLNQIEETHLGWQALKHTFLSLFSKKVALVIIPLLRLTFVKAITRCAKCFSPQRPWRGRDSCR